MALSERVDYLLKDTEKVRDAVKRQNTQIKDYSLKSLITVWWSQSEKHEADHLVTISIDDESTTLNNHDIGDAVQAFVDQEDEYGVFPRDRYGVRNQLVKSKPLFISMESVNWECLRDHVAEVTIGSRTALIDLDELLKAIRYA